MADKNSKGNCRYCGKSYSGGGIVRHLKACSKRQEQAGQLLDGKRGPVKDATIYHLQIEDTYAPMFWLNVEVPDYIRFGDLDQFLRDIWLECCGHLSVFRVGDQEFHSYPELAHDYGQKTMEVQIGKVLKPGLKFEHDYDFGSTTYLTLKVIEERKGQARGRPVKIMARNDPPVLPCDTCGKPAVELCPDYMWQGRGLLCAECGNHSCDYDFHLPLVNSPRSGECGYDGPSIEPD